MPLNLADTFDLCSSVGNKVDRYQNLSFRIYPQTETTRQWHDYTLGTSHEISCKVSSDQKSASISLPNIVHPVHLILPKDRVAELFVDEKAVSPVNLPDLLRRDRNAWCIDRKGNQAIIRVLSEGNSRVIRICYEL